jgi:hypothetical protein
MTWKVFKALSLEVGGVLWFDLGDPEVDFLYEEDDGLSSC